MTAKLVQQCMLQVADALFRVVYSGPRPASATAATDGGNTSPDAALSSSNNGSRGDDETLAATLGVVQSLATMPCELRVQLLQELQRQWRNHTKQIKRSQADKSGWWRDILEPTEVEVQLWTALAACDDIQELQYQHPGDLPESLSQLNLIYLRTLVLHKHEAVNDQQLALIVSLAPRLTALDVSYCTQLSDAGVEFVLLKARVALQPLSRNGLRMLSYDGIQAIRSCGKLQSVQLEGCLGISHLSALDLRPQITHVDLQGLSNLSDPNLLSFLALHWSRLRVLKLDETEFSTTSITNLMAQLQSPYAAVCELDLSWCSHCEDPELGSIFQKTPLLTSLKPQCLNIQDCVLHGLGASCCYVRLQILDLERCNGLTDDGFASLVSNGDAVRSLQKINVSWTAISSSHLEKLMVKSAKTLRRISLQGCRNIKPSILHVFQKRTQAEDNKLALSEPSPQMKCQNRNPEWPRLERFDCKWVDTIRDNHILEAARTTIFTIAELAATDRRTTKIAVRRINQHVRALDIAAVKAYFTAPTGAEDDLAPKCPSEMPVTDTIDPTIVRLDSRRLLELPPHVPLAVSFAQPDVIVDLWPVVAQVLLWATGTGATTEQAFEDRPPAPSPVTQGPQTRQTSSGAMSATPPPIGIGLEGSHGILYVCGEKTCGKLTINESLLGRKVRGIHGGYDQFVAVVDAWELEWEQHCDSDVALEHEIVNEGVQHVKIHQAATGDQHRLALSLDGQIFSWGARDSVLQSGELGQVGGNHGPRLWTNNTSSSKSQRLRISCPEDDNGDENNRDDPGMMSQSNAICQPRPVHASKELFFRKIACGRSHGAAITDKGDLYTWGRNFEGQLGHFSSTLAKEKNALLNGICAWPKFVSVFLSKPGVLDVSCGEMFTVALLENGAIYRFGERFTGITKHPETKSDANPHLLLQCGSDGSSFVGIACGFAHALAVTNSGQLYSWGWNNYGQLGLGSSSAIASTAIPKQVELPTAVEWSKVFAGGNYSAGISTTGELFTWGIGKHGQLGHGPDRRNCEFAPKPVDELQQTVISAVVCGERNLYAFAPTHIAGISPLSGEITGGYELRIKGSGLWASEDLIVRFIPLTEGRLPRGSLGVSNKATQEVVCQVPKFNLAGEFAVEVAMNGKHFTTNGHTFSAFKRPLVTQVSISESRLEGGEDAFIVLEGNLPTKNGQGPIIRFIPCTFDPTATSDENQFQQLPEMDAVGVLGTLENDDGSPTGLEDSPNQFPLSSTQIVRFVTPSFAATSEVLPCLMEISHNGGLHFAPIAIAQPRKDSTIAITANKTSSFHTQKQHVVWFHNAHVQRIRPNSFLTTALPQIIHVEVDQLLLNCGGISAIARVDLPQKAGDEMKATVSAVLKIQKVVDSNTIACVLQPFSQWEYVEVPLAKDDQVPPTPTSNTSTAASGDWWKRMPCTGFQVGLSVSINGGKSSLPYKSYLKGGKAEIYALPAMGKLWSVFPPVGMVCGGTKISISGDYFRFDIPDAMISLQWRGKFVQVPATCARLNAGADNSATSSSSEERRVVFQTPSLPFPGDRETAEAIAEGLVLGSHEEVNVFVALDGSHFADKSLKFTYCPVPTVLDMSPLEAEPGARMVVKVDCLVPSPNTCVRLTSVSTGISTVVPVEVNETSSSVEFVLPNLPITGEDQVRVAFSVNGQQFVEKDPPPGEGAQSGEAGVDRQQITSGGLCFRYKTPPPSENQPVNSG